MTQSTPIRSFKDLEVYRNLYKASIDVMTRIITKLPQSERFDLKNQLSRSCKAAPRLVAEGYAKKHQKRGFQKYIDDAMAECNECVVSIEQVKDIYHIEVNLCIKLVDIYDKSARQLFNLAIAWESFKNRRITPTSNDTGRASANTNSQ